MVRQGTLIGAQYSNYVPALFVIAVLMIAVNVTLSWLAVRLEKRLRRRSRTAAETSVVTATAERDTAGA
jgi:glutamate transport system permease protein